MSPFVSVELTAGKIHWPVLLREISEQAEHTERDTRIKGALPVVRRVAGIEATGHF